VHFAHTWHCTVVSQPPLKVTPARHTGWTAEALSILVGSGHLRKACEWRLKPLHSLALGGKGVEGGASEICQIRDVGKRCEDGEHCEAMRSMKKYDKTYQHMVHWLTRK